MNDLNFKNRTVAFIDILGFKNLLTKYPTPLIGDVYTRAVKLAQKAVNDWRSAWGQRYLNKPTCSVFIFSDSIAIFSPDIDNQYDRADLEGFLEVVFYTQKIMQSLIIAQFPFRGAIAFGETYLDKECTTFLGNGYMKALDLEKNQAWIGISVDKSIEERFPDYFASERQIEKIQATSEKTVQSYSHPSLIRYNVPLKCGHPELLYTVNWLETFLCHDENKKRVGNLDFINTIEKTLGDSSDLEVKKLYENTRKYVEYINSIYSFHEAGYSQHFVANDLYTR